MHLGPGEIDTAFDNGAVFQSDDHWHLAKNLRTGLQCDQGPFTSAVTSSAFLSAGTGGECSASRTGTSLFAAATRPWSDDDSVPFDLGVIADGAGRILQKVRPNSASVNKKPNPTLRANT